MHVLGTVVSPPAKHARSAPVTARACAGSIPTLAKHSSEAPANCTILASSVRSTRRDFRTLDRLRGLRTTILTNFIFARSFSGWRNRPIHSRLPRATPQHGASRLDYRRLSTDSGLSCTITIELVPGTFLFLETYYDFIIVIGLGLHSLLHDTRRSLPRHTLPMMRKSAQARARLPPSRAVQLLTNCYIRKLQCCRCPYHSNCPAQY